MTWIEVKPVGACCKSVILSVLPALLLQGCFLFSNPEEDNGPLMAALLTMAPGGGGSYALVGSCLYPAQNNYCQSLYETASYGEADCTSNPPNGAWLLTECPTTNLIGTCKWRQGDPTVWRTVDYYYTGYGVSAQSECSDVLYGTWSTGPQSW